MKSLKSGNKPGRKKSHKYSAPTVRKNPDGTVFNTILQFSKKSEPILKKMKKKILKEPVINEDDTQIKVNGEFASTIGVFTNKISIIKAFKNRKLENSEEI